MKKTLLLSVAGLMLASTAALSTHSVSAYERYPYTNYYKNDSRYLRQGGREALREAKYAAELQIRNLLNQYHVDEEEYNDYFNSYYRQARQSWDVEQVNSVINNLEKNLQTRQDDN